METTGSHKVLQPLFRGARAEGSFEPSNHAPAMNQAAGGWPAKASRLLRSSAPPPRSDEPFFALDREHHRLPTQRLPTDISIHLNRWVAYRNTSRVAEGGGSDMSNGKWHAKISAIAAIGLVLVVASPLAVPAGEAIALAVAQTPTLVGSISTNVIAQPTQAPGYSDWNPAVPDQAVPGGGVMPLISCSGQQPSYHFSEATNFSYPPFVDTFYLNTTCLAPPFSVTWTYGDGNTSTQSAQNITYSGAPNYSDGFIYNHTYHYVQAFDVSVTISNATIHHTSTAHLFSGFTPQLYYEFYNESGLINSGVNGSKSASIGLVEECNTGITNAQYSSDLRSFDSRFGLPNATLSFFNSGGGTCTNSGSFWPAIETAIDIEWAHVAAPGAKIYVCLDTLGTAAGLEGCDTAFYQNRSASHFNTTIVSNSWGFCAVGNVQIYGGCTNAVDPYASAWSTAESAGMNLLASVGDFGPNSICYSANYDASNPYGLAVGGTTVEALGAHGTYGSEKAWNDTGKAQQCSYYLGVNLHTYVGQLGETYGTNSHYTAPGYQSSLLGNTYRYFPDVSMDGSTLSEVPIVSQGTWYLSAGTSLGSPIWAGILDVLFQAHAPGLSGFAASFLYGNAACFHQITNPAGSRDGLGTPDVGCLSTA